MKVISLGWGVQSFTLAAMVALGELEPVDFAIHSDTGWERESTYAFRHQWEPWLNNHGVRTVTVHSERSNNPVDNGYSLPDIPANTITNKGMGKIHRQCTGNWKIMPMKRFIRKEMKIRNVKVLPNSVEQWIGITVDEWKRAKDSNVNYIVHRFPFLEMDMSRQDCLNWLEKNNFPSPGKSSCVFCPYHNQIAWKKMKIENGKDWENAIMIDNAIRNKYPPYPLFIHRSCVPLEEVVFGGNGKGRSELSLLSSDDDDAECDSGYCFL